MRLKLATKVSAAIVGVLLLAVLSSSVALVSAYEIGILMQRLVTENLASVVAAEELEIALLEQRGFVTSYMLDDGNNAWLDELSRREPAFQQWLAQARATAYTTEEREILAKIEQVFKEYDARRDEAVRLFGRGEADTARRVVLQDVNAIYDRAYQLCEDYLAANQRIVQARTIEGQGEMRLLTFVVAACVTLTIAAGAGLLWLFFSGVLLPLQRMAAEARSAAGTNFVAAGLPGDELHEVGSFLRTLMSDVTATRANLERSHERLMGAEKLASVGKLAASVAHEIRNPLTAVKMWLFSIRRSIGENPELERKFEIVTEEINRLESIIRNFLQFSRPPELVLKPHRISVLIDKTLELLAYRITEKNVRVRHEGETILPCVVADADQMRQVFINLINNSIESMADGGEIRISATAAPSNDGGMSVIVRVADSGPGMPEDARARIFEPFFTTKEGGTGLGLCIAARVMEQHGGRLVLECSTQQGTTFAIEIPAEASQ